jgi:hypothetical protein
MLHRALNLDNVQDRGQWWALMNIIMNFQVPEK